MASWSLDDYGLFTADGQRKYLDAAERERFIVATKEFDPKIRMFGRVLVMAGPRLNEALGLTPKQVLLDQKTLVFRSLKKRKKVKDKDGNEVNKAIYRSVPISDELAENLELVFNIRQLQKQPEQKPLWSVTDRQAQRWIRAIMEEANISGPQACPKGLRHTFGVHALMSVPPVPLNVLQGWFGHSDISVTQIYTTVIGREEREIASRMWAA